jgi:predicted nucleic acid-binding protein
MLYADTCYLGKYYLAETGRDEARRALHGQDVVCLAVGRVELIAAFHRKAREGTIDLTDFAALLRQFEADNKGGLWRWLPVTDEILTEASLAYRTLPAKVFLRAGDALHLVAARNAGLREIYSNDRHLLAAAPLFGLRGVNVITAP